MNPLIYIASFGVALDLVIVASIAGNVIAKTTVVGRTSVCYMSKYWYLMDYVQRRLQPSS